MKHLMVGETTGLDEQLVRHITPTSLGAALLLGFYKVAAQTGSPAPLLTRRWRIIDVCSGMTFTPEGGAAINVGFYFWFYFTALQKSPSPSLFLRKHGQNLREAPQFGQKAAKKMFVS